LPSGLPSEEPAITPVVLDRPVIGQVVLACQCHLLSQTDSTMCEQT